MTGEEVIRLRDSLSTQRNPLESHWDELAELFMPFRLQDGLPDVLSAERIFDSTGRDSALAMANGLASLIFPREEEWFELQPPRALRKEDEAVRAYRQASEIMREEIEASNFYEEAQECVIEGPVFGTTALFIGEVDEADGTVFYSNQPVRSYYIGEDHRGKVVVLVRDLDLTAEQAATEFGKDKLPAKVSQKLGKADGHTETFRFVHAVMRNPKPKKGGAARDAMAWRGVTVFEDTKETVREEGFAEFPFAVHRYRKFGRCPWGFGPGSVAKGDARQLNFLNELADVATEKDIFPPSTADAELEGEVDQGALGVTYVDSAEQANTLKEFGRPGGKYSAFERIQHKEQKVERAFHVDLFKLFSQRVQERGPLTATEASLVAGEKLAQFSPVFGRLVSEFLDPVLRRTFLVLFRAGKFRSVEWPESVVKRNGEKMAAIAAPEMLYKNRIVLAMQARENGKLLEFLQFAGPVIDMYPPAIDALELPTMMRDGARNAGLSEDWIATDKVFKERIARRAEAAKEAAALEKAEQASKAAGNLGRAPEEAQRAMIGGLRGNL